MKRARMTNMDMLKVSFSAKYQNNEELANILDAIKEEILYCIQSGQDCSFIHYLDTGLSIGAFSNKKL